MATASEPGPFAPLLTAVGRLGPAFADAGFQLHLVGGAVRDALLGDVSADTDPDADPYDDLDLTTDALPEQTLEIVGRLTRTVWTQGQRFGTIGAEIDGRPYEITTHRAERYDPDSRKPEVTFARALEEDLARRDFTINAMAVSVPDGELVDPYDGRGDLESRSLCTPLSAELSFTDDPLRMLRAGRFIARFGLSPVTEVVEAASEHAERIDIVSVERVMVELVKLLASAAPSSGLAFLDRVGLLKRVLPEADLTVPVDDLEPDAPVRLAALLMNSEPAEVQRRLRHLRASTADTQRVVGLLTGVRSLSTGVTSVSEADVRRWVSRTGDAWREALDLAQHLTPQWVRPWAEAVSALSVREDLDDRTLPVDGADVMAELGLEPGRAVGQGLARLHRIREEHGPMTRAEALQHLRSTR